LQLQRLPLLSLQAHVLQHTLLLWLVLGSAHAVWWSLQLLVLL
jgi:hypothetical protein